jgi:hypothetical protein
MTAVLRVNNRASEVSQITIKLIESEATNFITQFLAYGGSSFVKALN